MLKARDILLFLSVKYNGEWDKICNAIKAKEFFKEEQVIEAKKSLKCNYITILDDNYPSSLKKGHKPPFVIYYYGDIDLLNQTSVAFIGTNNLNKETTNTCKGIIKGLKGKFTIVSGINTETDKIVQESALKSNTPSIIVLTNGIDHECTYQDIYNQVKEKGLIISELPNEQETNLNTYPMAERLLASLGKKLTITQIQKKSNDMVVLAQALKEGKDVYVIPQAPNNGTFNNRLIMEGAALVENAEDLIEQ